MRSPTGAQGQAVRRTDLAHLRTETACLLSLMPNSGRCESAYLFVDLYVVTVAAIVNSVVLSRPGFVGGYDALASGMIIG